MTALRLAAWYLAFVCIAVVFLWLGAWFPDESYSYEEQPRE